MIRRELPGPAVLVGKRLSAGGSGPTWGAVRLGDRSNYPASRAEGEPTDALYNF
jgi:hypothetical protein